MCLTSQILKNQGLFQPNELKVVDLAPPFIKSLGKLSFHTLNAYVLPGRSPGF
jgi:hypothetical protein